MRPVRKHRPRRAANVLTELDGPTAALGRLAAAIAAAGEASMRELCVIAACAATQQDRQLHSHLHGALNVGVSPAALIDTLEALIPDLGADRVSSIRLLLARVIGK